TEKLDPACPQITVNINNLAFEFTKAAISGQKIGYYRYLWDNNSRRGWSFQEIQAPNRSGPVVNDLPGDVKTVYIGGFNSDGNAIRIANSSPATKDVQLEIDISSLGPGKTHYHAVYPPDGTFKIGPNFVAEPLDQKSIEVPVDEFRDNTADPMMYDATVVALVGGSVVDRQTIFFSLEAETPKIDLIAPDPAPAGTTVTITGSGFGTVQGSASEKTAEPGQVSAKYRGVASEVIFNQVPATAIKSWSDNKIEVTVPEGAATGTVVVKRGTVESNQKPFNTQATQNTVMGSKELSFDVMHYVSTTVPDIHGDVIVSWEVSGKGLAQNGIITPAAPGSDNSVVKLNGKLNEPIHVAFAAQGALSSKESRIDLPGGEYYLEAFHMKLNPEQLVKSGSGTVDPIIISDTSLAYDFTCTSSSLFGDSAGVWLELSVVRVVQKHDKNGALLWTNSDEYHESPIQFTFNLK
ncbi:MAG TPA: IPT/TIG domain-containing protein, partial [Dehalococcoidales bacterium]